MTIVINIVVSVIHIPWSVILYYYGAVITMAVMNMSYLPHRSNMIMHLAAVGARTMMYVMIIIIVVMILMIFVMCVTTVVVAPSLRLNQLCGAHEKCASHYHQNSNCPFHNR